MKWLLTLMVGVCAVMASSNGVGLDAEQAAQAETGAEKHEFKAEVNRLMDIIINSLYSNREIFLRELISNAADATDKMRFLAAANPEILKEGEELDIRIKVDKDAKTITITDKGVGMSKDELVKNLGIVAKSGTTEFLNAATQKGADQLSLIGQFGVGFYSVYLVADKVTVISKSDTDEQHIWESKADADFTVAKDPRGNTLGRGTSIVLHLKEDAEEFLNDAELEKIVSRYSQFVNFPILMHKSKQVTREVPIEVDPEEATKFFEKEDNEDLEVTEEAEEEEEKPKTEKITETVWDWEKLNKAKALWTRDPKEVSDDEYENFFNAFTKDKHKDGFFDKAHFSAEGEISFKALLFIPKKADPSSYTEMFNIKKGGVSLYVRRVMISDEFEDFLPRYMNFVRGIVDSEDLPLNVSRETLSQSRVLQVMAKKLVRKVLEMLRKMSEAEDVTPGADADADEGAEHADPNTDYADFWKEYGKSIKFGVIDDKKNKAKLTPLLRYKTSASDGKAVSLDSYVKRMKEDQKYIYYMTGESEDKIKKSPFLEKVTEKGYEVIYMADPLDEYVVGALTEYDGVELQSVTREGLKLGDEERKALKKNKETFKPLTEWFKKVYAGKVEKVVVSNRLGASPCVLVTGQYGMSANMERIVKGSTLQSSNMGGSARKTLEINVFHPIMQEINTKIADDAEESSLMDMAHLLLDSAMVSSGFTIEDHLPFYNRMSKILSAGLGLDPNAPVEEEQEDAPEEDEEDAADEEEVVEPEEEEEALHEEL